MKVIFFSDPHFSVDSEMSEEKWFPPLCSFFDKFSSRLVGNFLNFWDETTQQAFLKMLRVSASYDTCDLLVGLGDYTPGTNESGMITLKAVDQYMTFEESVELFFPNKQKIYVWGDHDAGYSFDVSGKAGVKIGTEEGGMSPDSINRAVELIGPPFGKRDFEEARFIWISTNLIRNVDNGSSLSLQNLKAIQERFLFESIENSEKKFNFILLHDPTAITLSSSINSTLFNSKSKISAILHGHLHANFSAKMMRIFCKPYRDLCGEIRTFLVPASWGMFGIGKGYATMEIDGNDFFFETHFL